MIHKLYNHTSHLLLPIWLVDQFNYTPFIHNDNVYFLNTICFNLINEIVKPTDFNQYTFVVFSGSISSLQINTHNKHFITQLVAENVLRQDLEPVHLSLLKSNQS